MLPPDPNSSDCHSQPGQCRAASHFRPVPALNQNHVPLHGARNLAVHFSAVLENAEPIFFELVGIADFHTLLEYLSTVLLINYPCPAADPALGLKALRWR